MTPAQRIALSAHNSKWYWKQRNYDISSVTDEMLLPLDHEDITQGWNETSFFPSEIHVELLKKGKIPDPFVGFNEHLVQWIGEEEWLYKCSFTLSSDTNSNYAWVEFEGLDTICDVYLNHKFLGTTANMFHTHKLTIPNGTEGLQGENSLLLHFKSAKLIAKAEEARRGKVRAGSTNLGDPSRVYLRKAQYDWRWDWGPELMTCGPYRPITVVTYDVAITEVQAHASLVGEGQFTPKLVVDVGFTGGLSEATFMVTLMQLSGKEIQSGTVNTLMSPEGFVKNVVDWDLPPGEVLPWWPVGYGNQELYWLRVSLLDSTGQTLDSTDLHIGFRNVRLVQNPLVEPDEYGSGTTFYFEINGVKMFMGGSNWIPADNFLTRINAEKFRALLSLMKEGGQNMVRLWGGGVYEPDEFYDICDELGILVWQDFQFACGVYPAHSEFLANVKAEAENVVKRLRHHPSLVLFCGNNEDYQQVLQWGDVSSLPAIKIYEELLPSVVHSLTSHNGKSTIPYHRGSPYGGKGWDTADPTVGDVHVWDIWGGKEKAYQEYGCGEVNLTNSPKLGGRFISEFGIPSFPSLRTVKYWMTGAEEREWSAQSRLMAQHCRAGSFERRFAILLNENFRITEDFETHVYNTQLLQAEAVGYAYAVWRRKWAGDGKEYTGGVLVWQLNDCWPVTSWAMVDYFLRAKPVYYVVKRQLATTSVGIFRTVHKNRENDRPKQFYESGPIWSSSATLTIWATNSGLQPREVNVLVSYFDLDTNWKHDAVPYSALLLPNQTTELGSTPCLGPSPEERSPKQRNVPMTTLPTSSSVVASVRLVDSQSGEVIARYTDWPQPYKYLDRKDDQGLKIIIVDTESEQGDRKLLITAEKPIKGLFLSPLDEEEDGDDEVNKVRWSDNALDVVPGDPQTVFVKGLKGGVSAAWFGREKSRRIC